MKVVNLAQRTPEWLEWRRHGVSASEASILLGRNPYKTRWRLWAEKVGIVAEEDLSRNPHVQRGIRLEDAARRSAEKSLEGAYQAAEGRFGEILLPLCAESREHPIIRASYDGVRGNREPVELKCPCESVWREVVNMRENCRAYQLYYPQIQQQIFVSDVDRGWMLFYSPEDNGDYEMFEVIRDNSMLNDLVRSAYVFWNHIQHKKPPKMDPKRDLYVPDGYEELLWREQAAQYIAYEAQIREVNEQLKALKSSQKVHLESMKSMMGEFQSADYAGLKVTRYASQARLSQNRDSTGQTGELFGSDQGAETKMRCRATVAGSNQAQESSPKFTLIQKTAN